MKSRFITLLRWSERYTKTDMVYLFHGGFWLGIAQLAASISGLILIIVLANILEPEVLGEYRFLMSAFLILSIFSLPGMHTAILESTPKGFLGNLTTAVKSMFSYSILGTIFSLLICTYYLWQQNYDLALGFLAIAIALPFFESSFVYSNYLKSLKRFAKVTKYTLITKLFLLFIMSVTVFYYPDYAWLVITIFFIANILPNFLFTIITKRTWVTTATKNDPLLTPYAKHLTIMMALGLIALQLDKIFVWNLIGAEELAIFYIAYAIPQEAANLFQIIPTIAYPKFANQTKDSIKNSLMPKMLKFLFIITVICIIYVALSPYIFQLIFSESYQDAVKYSQVLIFATLVSAFSPITTYLTIIKNVKFLYLTSVISPAIRIVFVLLLTLLFGIWGTVAAVMIEVATRIILLIYFFYKS